MHGEFDDSVDCLEIDMMKYIFLSSVIARKLNFKKLLKKMHFDIGKSLLSHASELYE